MIQDAQNMYSDDQNLTSTGASTNLIDHRIAIRNLGIGTPLALVIVVQAIDASSGDETYVAQLQSDDNAGFSSPTSWEPSITIPRGSAVGTKFVRFLTPDTLSERYSRVNFTLGGTTPSITIDAWLVPASAIQEDAYYTDAITIG